MATNCLACGQEVLKGSRAAASTVHGLLKRLLVKRCRENDVELNLDSVIALLSRFTSHDFLPTAL